MEWLSLMIIIGFVIVIATFKLTKQNKNKSIKQSKETNEYPYKKNEVLFSAAERSFLGALEQGIGNKYRIFGKVRVADIVSVKPMSNRSAWQRAFNQISAKHFDFVLCRNDDLSIIAIIELNDKSHQAKKRQDRDTFIVNLCNAIELPLIQIPAKAAYTVSDIEAKVTTAIN